VKVDSIKQFNDSINKFKHSKKPEMAKAAAEALEHINQILGSTNDHRRLNNRPQTAPSDETRRSFKISDDSARETDDALETPQSAANPTGGKRLMSLLAALIGGVGTQSHKRTQSTSSECADVTVCSPLHP
jgi:hypothetical protein